MIALLLAAQIVAANPTALMSADTTVVTQEVRRVASTNRLLIQQWAASSPVSCDDPLIQSAEIQAHILSRVIDANYRRIINRNSSNVERYHRTKTVEMIAPDAIGSSLDLGKAYLNGGCVDKAEAIYRGVVIQYTGELFRSYVEQARFGLEDVRAAAR